MFGRGEDVTAAWKWSWVNWAREPEKEMGQMGPLNGSCLNSLFFFISILRNSLLHTTKHLGAPKHAKA
jgi:hypothetical protein